MATIVLGVVGGVVGGIIGHGNPLAIQKGWAIGTTIGGLIDASNKPSVRSEVGKLTDLRYSGSNYGAAIPKVWGKTMVAGNFIWVANYLNNSTLVASGTADSTHLIEHKESSGGGGGGSGGGGGGGSVTEYWYSASYAVAFCEASSFKDDGSFSNRNPVIKKLWANDVLIYDVDAPANNKVTIRFHYGGETEMPDTLIEQAEGTGNAPAYRGLVYVVIQDHNLKPFGNQLPNIRAEIHTNTVNVKDICEDICGQVNLYGTRIDFSLATALVKGYIVSNRGNAQSLIEPILATFATDAAEIDGKLKLIPRGASVAVNIYENDNELGVVSEGNSPVIFQKKLGVRSELPGRVDLSYFDLDKNYQQVTQTDIKQSADFYNPTQISLSVTMTATEARQAAARILDSAYLENDPITVSLSHKYRYLSPGDVLYLGFLQYWWDSGRFRVIKIDETSSENTVLTCVKDEPSTLTQVVTGSGGSGGGGNNNTTPVPCNFYTWSGLELREQDRQSCGFYVAATWAANGQGGACHYSTDGGTTWIYGGYIGTRTPFGSASTALANGTAFNTWDNTNTVDISITNDGVSVLQSTTQDGVLNGTNIAMLGNELIGFVTTQLLSAYSYRLSNLRRGIRSSPYTGHTNTDKFVVVSSSVLRISLAETYVGSTVRVKVVAPGQTLADVTHQNVVIFARNPSDIEVRLSAIDSPKNPNLVYAGPNGGSPAQPTFRALVNADLPDMANNTIKGRSTAGTGDPEDLTGAQVSAILPIFGSTTKGVVPAPNPAGTTRYLREDGTWAIPSGGGGISSINGATSSVQNIVTGSSGSDFNINTSAGIHTVNIPSAGIGVRGLVNSSAQTFQGNKVFRGTASDSSSSCMLFQNSSATNLGEIRNDGHTSWGGGISSTYKHFFYHSTSGINDGRSLVGGRNIIAHQISSVYPSASRFDMIANAGTNTITYLMGLTSVISQWTQTGTISEQFGGSFSSLHTSTSGALTISANYGMDVVARIADNAALGTIGNNTALRVNTEHFTASSATVGNDIGVSISVRAPGGGITNSYGLLVKNPFSGGGTIDNRVGISVEDQSVGTNVFAFNFEGTSGLARQGIWWNKETVLYRASTNTLRTNSSFIVDKRVTAGVVTLTDAATIALDASLGNHFKVTLAGNRTLGVPTNAVDGQKIMIEVIQDATGSRTLTLTTGSAGSFAFGSDITGVTLSTAANKVDFIGCVYSSSAQRWRVIAFVKGY